MFGGAMAFMPFTVPEEKRGFLFNLSMVMVAIELVLYWTMQFSFPGIPEQIMRKAAGLEAQAVGDDDEELQAIAERQDGNSATEPLVT